MFLPQSRFDPATMFEELVGLAERHIDDIALRELVVDIFAAGIKINPLVWQVIVVSIAKEPHT